MQTGFPNSCYHSYSSANSTALSLSSEICMKKQWHNFSPEHHCMARRWKLMFLCRHFYFKGIFTNTNTWPEFFFFKAEVHKVKGKCHFLSARHEVHSRKVAYCVTSIFFISWKLPTTRETVVTSTYVFATEENLSFRKLRLTHVPWVTRLMTGRAQGSICLSLDLCCYRLEELFSKKEPE